MFRHLSKQLNTKFLGVEFEFLIFIAIGNIYEDIFFLIKNISLNWLFKTFAMRDKMEIYFTVKSIENLLYFWIKYEFILLNLK